MTTTPQTPETPDAAITPEEEVTQAPVVDEVLLGDATLEEPPAAVAEEIAVEEAVVVDEAVAVEDVPATEETPVVEDAPAAEEAPVVEEVPAVEDAPVVEDAPAAEEAPVVEDAPAAEQAPVVEETPVTKDAPAVAKPAPRPGPGPKPRPRPVAQQAAPAARPATPVVPVPDESAEIAAASAFGRVAEDGTVTVIDGETERVVGQYAGADATEALGLYVRRFLDLKAQVALLEARLATVPAKEANATLATLTEQLLEPAAVGDLAGLRARLATIAAKAEELKAEATAQREAARAAAIVERTAIVEEVEAIAATPPERIQWRTATARLGTLLESWKSAQRSGARIDRPTEDSLWKRFSHARTAFDKARRTHFADLDRRNGEARSVKDELVAKAEALAGSTDWGPTGSAFRDLMDAWRVAPRGSRKEDDALWARFKGAQDTFFGARTKANELIDSEYGANLEVKNELLVRAEALLPITDLASVKRSLRDIQDAWDAAGKVPRAAVQSTEARLRAVEQAVRDAEQAEYRRSDPEVKARVEGATAQLLDSITALEAEIAAAEAAGKSKEAAKAKDALATKQQWLEIVRRAES